MSMTPTELEKLRRGDHDNLISLSIKFDDFLLRYQSDMNQLKDGYSTKLSDHEARIKVMEKIVDQTNPLIAYQEFVLLKNEVRDFKTTANAYRVAAGLLGGLLMFLITQLPNLLRTLGVIK